MTKSEELTETLVYVSQILDDIREATKNFRGFKDPSRVQELSFLVGKAIALSQFYVTDKV